MGANVLAAAGLKQMGPRTLGFQNPGSVVAEPHERSTKQRKPFLPRATVVYPSRPKTITVASADMEGGAALLANAISAFSGIKYWLTGAIDGYIASRASAGGCQSMHAESVSATKPGTASLTACFGMSFSYVRILGCRLEGISKRAVV